MPDHVQPDYVIDCGTVEQPGTAAPPPTGRRLCDPPVHYLYHGNSTCMCGAIPRSSIGPTGSHVGFGPEPALPVAPAVAPLSWVEPVGPEVMEGDY